MNDYELNLCGNKANDVNNSQKSPIMRIEVDREYKNILVGDQKGSIYFLDRNNIEKQQVNREIRCGGSSI